MKPIPVIHVVLKGHPDLQEWARQARAENISLPDFVRQAMREKIAAARATNAIMQEMSERVSQMEAILKRVLDGVAPNGVPSVDTFVRDTPPPYDAQAAELFGDAEGVGWE